MSKVLDEKLLKLSKKELELHKLRHTAEHVLHTAMQNLYPQLKKAMGPATDEGFYFDFDVEDHISEDHFPKIEAEMKRLINKNLKLVQDFITPDEAKKNFANNPYKLEWVEQIVQRGEHISIYKMVDHDDGVVDLDLCSGPHANYTSKIKAFKLLSVAGAYWHGDEKNKMLTRIYGTVWPSKEELDKYLLMQQEAKKRDHRKLGQDLGLFVFSDLIGKGLPMLTAKGATIRRVLERFIVDEEIRRDYQHVITPPLAKVDLYRMSGHYPYYKETMYPEMKVDDEKLILRPMTCPHHFMLYKSSPHSYKELPIRLAEISPQFRYEKSGELTGLIRVRMFMLADAHIVCMKNQAKSEIKNVLDLIDFVNNALGLKKGVDYRYRLSLGDRNESKKYYKDDASWDLAEQELRDVLIETKAPYYEAKNEAAFYGPKIDVQIKNIHGKEETAFTVQYDFVMPKRFSMRFVDEDGKEKEPIVIHRASLGCFERTMAFLIEHYAGAFPPWLAPVQVAVLPISDQQHEYAKLITEILKSSNIRAISDLENQTIGKKIRNSTLQKIPYMIIIGEKEKKRSMINDQGSNTKNKSVGAGRDLPNTNVGANSNLPANKQLFISVRSLNGKNIGEKTLYEFIHELNQQIEKRI